MSTVAARQLDTAYPLDDASIRRLREDGFIRLSNVLSPETLHEFAPDINRVVDENNRLKDIPLEKRTLYDQAFVQVTNIWTRNQHVRELAFSKRLARVATELMGTRGKRCRSKWDRCASAGAVSASESVAISRSVPKASSKSATLCVRKRSTKC